MHFVYKLDIFKLARLRCAAYCLATMLICNLSSSVACAQAAKPAQESETMILRIGIIGLDTSHATNFAKIINAPDAPAPFDQCHIVAAVAQGSRDIRSSVERVPGYTKTVQELGVEIVDSIDDLLPLVDAVLLESNDGKPHLEQVLPVLKAGLPVFVDKPLAASLVDTLAIFEAARTSGTPLFSSSSLRYAKAVQSARAGTLVGKVIGVDTFSPAPTEPSHPDFYWYGIHGVEPLVAAMGPGCATVSRTHTEGTDLLVCTWSDGRIGTVRGIRDGRHNYGGIIHGVEGEKPTGGYEGYAPLLVEIVKFFQSKEVPIASQETIEIYALMSAADASLEQNGAAVSLSELIAEAQAKVPARLAEFGWK
ncbi:Gfo/Idh/MocA family protein [Aureliella helgolandensis]|uniref:1,5-anhydro-D-fructose reductase n=1 Tax=Aureliella helgolandensis TaxID=2527968 RepID=A0A518G964_9BACT|nr:Gfo/Idh/MocA family oxidoreductase [Aureliella helgolandensis]QDV25137.1 1,5-anhydro-D-fructose reductase [Aureliella helgolandensis]